MNHLKFVVVLSIITALVFFLHFPLILLINRSSEKANRRVGGSRGNTGETVRYESKTVSDDELRSLIQKFPQSYANEAAELRRTRKIHVKVRNGFVSVTEKEKANVEEDDGKPDIARIKRHVNTTLVTALLDIGRGDWEIYQRPLQTYHEFMKNVLSLRVPMVIFVDSNSYNFARRMRAKLGLKELTKVWKISISDLPLFTYYGYAQEIIAREKHGDAWRSHWDPKMKFHPEASSADYNIVVNSKPYFLYNTTIENPFGTNFFTWLDAGYGHGDATVFPRNFYWFPTFPPAKISLIKLTPKSHVIAKYDIDALYRINLSVISGGFLAGDAEALHNFYVLFHRKMIELISRNYIDDDQTTLVLVVKENPTLFEVEHGDWFDAFQLF